MPIAGDAMPLVRVARGETLSNVQLDWDTPDGLRTVLDLGHDADAREPTARSAS